MVSSIGVSNAELVERLEKNIIAAFLCIKSTNTSNLMAGLKQIIANCFHTGVVCDFRDFHVPFFQSVYSVTVLLDVWYVRLRYTSTTYQHHRIAHAHTQIHQRAQAKSWTHHA